MTFWWWVLVFGGIALAAIALYTVLGLGLWRRAKVLLAELNRLSEITTAMSAAIDQPGPTSHPHAGGPLGAGGPGWTR